MFIIILGHFCGCGFHYIAWINEGRVSETWLDYYGLYHASTAERYLKSIYFSFITMVTVGYGDIVPISQPEIIYVICMTFICNFINMVMKFYEYGYEILLVWLLNFINMVIKFYKYGC